MVRQMNTDLSFCFSNKCYKSLEQSQFWSFLSKPSNFRQGYTFPALQNICKISALSQYAPQPLGSLKLFNVIAASLRSVTSELPFEQSTPSPQKEDCTCMIPCAYACLCFRTSGFFHMDFLPYDKSVDFIRVLGDRLVFSWIIVPSALASFRWTTSLPFFLRITQVVLFTGDGAVVCDVLMIWVWCTRRARRYTNSECASDDSSIEWTPVLNRLVKL